MNMMLLFRPLYGLRLAYAIFPHAIADPPAADHLRRCHIITEYLPSISPSSMRISISRVVQSVAQKYPSSVEGSIIYKCGHLWQHYIM